MVKEKLLFLIKVIMKEIFKMINQKVLEYIFMVLVNKVIIEIKYKYVNLTNFTIFRTKNNR